MALIDFLLLISEETGNDPIPNIFLYSRFVVELFAFIIALIFVVRIVKYRQEGIIDSLRPIRYIMYALLLRLLISIIVSLLNIYFSNTRTLVFSTFFQTVPWMVIIGSVPSIFNSLIRVPTKRKLQIRRLSRLAYASAIFLFLIALLGLLPLDVNIEAIIAVVLLFVSTILLWVISIRIWRESKKTSSKLTSIRLQMLGLGLGMVSFSFSLTPYLIILAITGQLTPMTRMINTILSTSSSLFAVYFIDGVFFSPKWMKKRHGLVEISEDLL